MSKKASPLCDCGASEETAKHCLDQKNIDKLDLMCKGDSEEMKKFVLETKKLNKDEEA